MDEGPIADRRIFAAATSVTLTILTGLPLFPTLFLGLRGDGAASFGDVPFYLRPFITLRGAPIMQYQGDEVAHIEGELRWQCWKRFSLVGFAGVGTAWNTLRALRQPPDDRHGLSAFATSSLPSQRQWAEYS